MSRNTVRFSAFSLLLWTLYSFNLALIALAHVTSATSWWVVSVTMSVALLCLMHRRSQKRWTRIDGKANGIAHVEGQGVRAKAARAACQPPRPEDMPGLMISQQQAIAPIRCTLPGLPPLCLN